MVATREPETEVIETTISVEVQVEELETEDPSVDDAPSDSAQSPDPEPATEEPRQRPVPAFDDPRRVVLDWCRERVESQLQPVTDGTWEGVQVVTRADLFRVLQDALPEASKHSAAVKTPAFVYVDAVCPRCRIAGEIALEIDTQLVVNSPSSAELKLKAKAKARPHQCGQQRIVDVTPPVSGQQPLPTATDAEYDEPEDLGDEDIPRETAVLEADAGLDLGGCPFSGCLLAAEHEGDHSVASRASAPTVDDDLLPF